jgi:hypothetical protein
MKGKLFTFGCSYTSFHWPTWPDFLRPVYNKVYNYAHAGAGNTYIFSHFMHAINQNLVNKEDTVIVQWSGLPREDKIFSGHTTFTTGGLIYNNPSYDEAYYSKYYSPYQKGLELITYIKAVRLICKNLGIKYKMFNMFPQWVSDFLGEPYGYDTALYQNAYSELTKNGLLNEIKKLNNNSDFIQISLEEFNLDNRKQIGYQCVNGKASMDSHPTPYIHYRYAKEVILENLNEEYTYLKESEIKETAKKWDEEVTDKKHIDSLCSVKHKSLYNLYTTVWPHSILNTNMNKPYILDYPEKII